MRKVNNEIAEVLEDPRTSTWLRETLRSAIQRDPVDAANDAQRLASLLTGRLEAMIFLNQWQQPSSGDTPSSLELTDPYLA